jgi:hypothetical protein
MSRPTPLEDHRENAAMGRAAVAGENHRAIRDDIIGGLPQPEDIQALLDRRETQAREAACARATKHALRAYPVLGYGQGWFAVPSQSELGAVYLVHMNVRTDQPNSCTCPNMGRWCTHAGAARLFIDEAKAIYDAEQMSGAVATITNLKEQHPDANAND